MRERRETREWVISPNNYTKRTTQPKPTRETREYYNNNQPNTRGGKISDQPHLHETRP